MKKRQEWTRTEIDRVGELVAQGWGITRISREVNRDYTTVRRLIRSMWPFRPAAPSTAMPEDDFLGIKALIDGGLNTKNIMRRTGYSQEQVLAARAERVRRNNAALSARRRLERGPEEPPRRESLGAARYADVPATALYYEDAAWASGRKVPPARDLDATVAAWLLDDARRAAA